MNGYIIKQEKYDNLTIKILPDDDPGSPREWDNLGTMVCFHSRYNLGDSHKLTIPGGRDLQAEVEKGGGIVLPLYLYDHSGLTMNTTGFSCPWDSGCVGFVYVTAEKIRKEYGKRITKTVREKVRGVLVAEVEAYDQFLRGDIVGYVVEDEEENLLDSCWGYYSADEAFKEGLSMAKYLVKERGEKLVAAEEAITGS